MLLSSFGVAVPRRRRKGTLAVQFWLQQDGPRWTWTLTGPDDQRIAAGAHYHTRAEAVHAISLVKGVPGNGCRFGKVQTASGRWYWHLKSLNGKVLTRGAGYLREADVDLVISAVSKTSDLTPIRVPARTSEDPSQRQARRA